MRVCDGFGSCVNSDTIRINICEIPQGAFEKTLEAVIFYFYLLLISCFFFDYFLIDFFFRLRDV